MATNGRSLGGDRAVDHQIIYSEAVGCHCGAHCQMAHILTMHEGGKYSGIQKIQEVAGSRRGTGGRVTRRMIHVRNNCVRAVNYTPIRR